MEHVSVTEFYCGSGMSEQDSWELPFYSPSSVEDEKFPLLYELVEHSWEDVKEGETKCKVWSETSQADNSHSQLTIMEGLKRRRPNSSTFPSDSSRIVNTISLSETDYLHYFPSAQSPTATQAICSDSSITSAPAVCMSTKIKVSQVDEILETAGQPPIFHTSTGKSEEELREQRRQHLRALRSLTPEQRTLRRILRNRKSAANARKRHVERLQRMEEENAQLKSRICYLEEKLREYEKRD